MYKPSTIVFFVFIASFLAAPLIYTLDKLVLMESSKWVFLAGVIVLPLFGLLSTLFVQQHEGKNETLYYVWCIFSFTAVVDLFIGLELDGFVKGFMEFYLREGEPYLRSSYGTSINWWDGTGHFSMYLGLIYLLVSGRDYRLLCLYWVGSITHSMIVFMPGNVIGNKGLKWSYFLNVPYVFYPIYAGVRCLRMGMKNRWRIYPTEKKTWEKVAERLFAVWFLAAIVMASFRFICCMGCKEKITQYYLKEIEPYLNDPTQYGRTQALCYFYYFTPVYVAFFCSLIYPGELWVKDWSLIHAGASMQAQFVYIWSSLKWRTKPEFQVPDTVEARCIFWTVNLSLVIVPHLFAWYCHKSEIRDFFNDCVSPCVSPKLKSFQGEGRTFQKVESIQREIIYIQRTPEKNEDETPTRRVTRSQKKLK
ncbi:transmembrane 6 superfamily member 1-like [Ruditapes philippinarum]|uniref:transmembrane 6 superfamily member 1-like n=1 Tax=Ruditapes philippinarum TaxID=129788 RepID=UPI00295A85AB|nr:transmembrane 6 superfamily member 1-like [Ruditapes philippinarum]